MTHRRTHWLIGMLAMTLVLWPSVTPAAAPAGTYKIEQDWRVELYTVSNPDKTTCPLFVTGFALPNLTTLFQVTWNHRDLPDLEHGGIQVQAYRWDNLLQAVDVVTPAWRDKLSNDGEVITWKQKITKKDDVTHEFCLSEIKGTTWGEITEHHHVTRTYLSWAPTLETYDVETIKKHSAIVMGTNRFKKLSITQTRFYDKDNHLLATDPSEKVIFGQPQTYDYFEDTRLGD